MTAAVRPAFVLDVNRCVGCRACEMACVIANGLDLSALPASGSWREVRTFNELNVPGIEQVHLSLACNHCTEAPCLEQCPARAYHRDRQTGAVLIDTALCLGCRYCAWVCPYDAPRFDSARGVMTKCTFCADRQHEGRQPACTECCPTGALTFAHLSGEQLTQDVVGFAQAGIGPAVQVIGLHDSRRLPHTHLPPASPPWRVLRDRITPHITLRHEWVLAVFTLLLAVLTGLLGGAASGRVDVDWRGFLAAGVLGSVLSASHLGRKERTWRAGLHVQRSRLSREVLLSGVFVAAGTLSLVASDAGGGPLLPGWFHLPDGFPGPGGLLPSQEMSWAAMALGLVTLLTVDLVYRVARIRGSGALHSAQVLGTGLLQTALAVGDLVVLVSLAVLKLVLFWARMRSRRRAHLAPAVGWLWLRSGLLLGGVTVAATATGFSWPAAALLTGAELVDRALFYSELEIRTPRTRMLDEMARRTAETHARST